MVFTVIDNGILINWEKSQIKAEKHDDKSLFLFFRSKSINSLTFQQVPLVALKIGWVYYHVRVSWWQPLPYSLKFSQQLIKIHNIKLKFGYWNIIKVFIAFLLSFKTFYLQIGKQLFYYLFFFFVGSNFKMKFQYPLTKKISHHQ